jgi:hypothetical protein
MKSAHAASISTTVASCLLAVAGAAIASTASTVKFAAKPTAALNAAIRRAVADDIKEFTHPDKDGWIVAQADLNDDGRPDLLVQYSDSGFCGSLGCSGAIVMATADGYADKAIDSLPNFVGDMDVLASKHHGMHDLHMADAKDSDYSLQWDGMEYRS